MYLPTEEDPDTEVETTCKKLVPVFGELSFVSICVMYLDKSQTNCLCDVP